LTGSNPVEAFLSLAAHDVSAIFARECTAGLEIEQLRRQACTRVPPADGGEGALRWFALQTQRLEHLRALEEVLINELMHTTAAMLEEDDVNLNTWIDDTADDRLSGRLDRQLLPLVRQQARELEQLSAQLASLQDSLEERTLIDKAKNILMNHQNMSEEQAWQCLRKMAMDKNQRMVEIARALLTVRALWPLTPKE